MRIAVAQMNTPAGDFEATVDKMLAYAAQARRREVDLLVYPSAAFMGIDPGALLQDEGFMTDMTSAMTRLEAELGVTALVPFVFDAGGMAQSDVAIVRDGQAMPLTLASRLSAPGGGRLLAGFLSSMFGDAEGLGDEIDDIFGDDELDGTGDDAPWGISGLGPSTFSVAGTTVGVALSYDDIDAFCDSEAGVDVICYLPTVGYDTDDEASCLAPSVSDGCFLEDVSDANAWLVAAGGVGAYERNVFCGGSFVMAPWGELAAVAPSFTEDLLVCDLDVMGEGPLADAVQPPAYDRTRMLWDACVLAVRDHAEKRGCKGAAVLVDGSLGSCVTAAIATDALGPMRVSALVCAEDDAARADARECVRRLRIRDVDELGARNLAQAVGALGGDDDSGLVAGVVGARLAALARGASFLALSDADKTALAIGEGPQGGPVTCGYPSFAPLGDIYRSDVARLARYRNTVSNVLPQGALARMAVPRGLGLDGLAGRPEVALSKLDAALLLHIERGAGITKLLEADVAQEFDEAILGRLLARIQDAEPARRCAPYYPAFSARSLDEVPVPLAYGWSDHARDSLPEPPTPEKLYEVLLHAMDQLSQSGVGPAGEARDNAPDAPELRDHLSEMLGYLQDLSGERQLRSREGGSSSAPSGPDTWLDNLFSDN